MTKKEQEILSQLEQTKAKEERAKILDNLTDEEQFHLDQAICFGAREMDGTACFPYRNGNFFNEKPSEKAPWIPNRYVALTNKEELLELKPIDKKDNYRCINILKPDTDSRCMDDVAYINEIYADMDVHVKSEQERKKIVEGLQKFLEDFFDSGKLPRPTTFLFSGRGFALHYLLTTPIKVGTEEAIQFAALYQCAFDTLETLFEGTEYEDIVEVDRCVCSLSRLARMAGTYNTKGDCVARFIDVTAKQYTLEELEKALVTDVDDFNHRVELRAAGKGITKSAMCKYYATLNKKMNREARRKASPQQQEKIKRAAKSIKQYADPEADIREDEAEQWKRVAKYELTYMNNYFREKEWRDGDGRYNYCLIYYSLCRTLYHQWKAEYLLRAKVELMSEPIGEDTIERIVYAIEDTIEQYGHPLWYTLDKIIEVLNIDEDTAYRCGFTAAKVQDEMAKEHIDAALERDKAILQLHQEGKSNRWIAKWGKEEHPEWKISKSTVDRVVEKWAGKEIETAERSIYCTYDTGSRVAQLSHIKENKSKKEDTSLETMEAEQPQYLQKLELMKQQELSIEEDNLFKDYILDVLKKGTNMMIHGMGGTGKTYLLREFIKWCEQNGRKVVVLTPTGIASTNYDKARTIHSYMKLPKDVIDDNELEKEQLESFAGIDVVIIDEISMVRCDLMDAIEKAIRYEEEKRGKQIQRIYSGDIGQLPCVALEKDKKQLAVRYESRRYMFFDSKFFADIKMLHVRLDKNRRTYENEAEYAMMLRMIHDYDATAIEYFNQRCISDKLNATENTIKLASKRAVVKAANHDEIQKHKDDESFTYLTAGKDRDAKECDYPANFVIPAYIGMRVMTVINKKESHYMNGTVGTITEIEEGCITILTDRGKKIKVFREKLTSEEDEEKYIYQFPIMPAYALTIHKSQGLSLERAIIDPDCFAPGQLYTALSRLRSVDGLYLTQPIKEDDIKRNQEADEFIESLDLITAYNYQERKQENDAEPTE